MGFCSGSQTVGGARTEPSESSSEQQPSGNPSMHLVSARLFLEKLVMFQGVLDSGSAAGSDGFPAEPAGDGSGQRTESEPAGHCERVQQDQRKPVKPSDVSGIPPLCGGTSQNPSNKSSLRRFL